MTQGGFGRGLLRALGPGILVICTVLALAPGLARPVPPRPETKTAARLAGPLPGRVDGLSTLGDFVWHDANADGMQQPQEEGIDGVLISLYLDDDDAVFDPERDHRLDQTWTGDNVSTPNIEHGWYEFQIWTTDALYWVVIEEANFQAGGRLAGFVATTAERYGPNPMLVYLPPGLQTNGEADFGYARAGLSLMKRAGDTPDGQVRVVPPPGEMVSYEYSVTNTGELALAQVSITDDNGTPGYASDDVQVCLLPGLLKPGASAICTWSTFVGSGRTNIATASGIAVDPYGRSYEGDPITATDDAVVLVGLNTATPTVTASPTGTPTQTLTPTPTGTTTETATNTPTATGTVAPDPSQTPTEVPTPTETASSTPTPTASATRTATPTCPPAGCRNYLPIIIRDPAPTPTPTPTVTPAPTFTPSPTPISPEGLAHPKSVVVHPLTHRVYLTSRENDRVYALDGAALHEDGYTSAGDEPWGIAVNPQTNKLYVANFASGDITVLDAATLAHVSTIAVGGHPTFVKINPGTNKVFAVLYGSDQLAVIDGGSDTLEAKVHAGGVGAWGLALNTNLNRVYVSARDSGSITTFMGYPPYSQIKDQARQACGGAGSSPYSMDFNPMNDRLYVACSPYHDVNTAGIYRTSGNGLTLLAFTRIGNGGDDGGGGVAVNTTTNHVFFTNSASDSVSVIGENHAVLVTLGTGRNPFGVDVDPGTGRVYVVNRDSNDVSVIQD